MFESAIKCVCRLVILTVSSLLEVRPERWANAKVQSVPILVAVVAADLCPLEDDLQDHPDVHRNNAKPQNVLLPSVAHA
jgi:hypothetical protein